MKKKKISDAQLVQEHEINDKTLKEIADEYGYGDSGPQTLSRRLKKLLPKSTKYVKLSRVNNSNTRLLSIPVKTLKKIGVDPDKELKAKRKIVNGQIVLEVEEDE